MASGYRKAVPVITYIDFRAGIDEATYIPRMNPSMPVLPWQHGSNTLINAIWPLIRSRSSSTSFSSNHSCPGLLVITSLSGSPTSLFHLFTSRFRLSFLPGNPCYCWETNRSGKLPPTSKRLFFRFSVFHHCFIILPSFALLCHKGPRSSSRWLPQQQFLLQIPCPEILLCLLSSSQNS